jgi:hypothetical protein
MGMAGSRHKEFQQKIFAHPHRPVAAPGVKDKNLKFFVMNTPFNFALEQALN